MPGTQTGNVGTVERLPHPVTGALMTSPATPGDGWPGDAATSDTPRANSAIDVRRLAADAPDLTELSARLTVCRACPRLVAWRKECAHVKKAAYADQPYWGRPVAGFGDTKPWLLAFGLAPAANGGNRTGRNFTGDPSAAWLFEALHRAGLATLPTSDNAGDGQRLTGVRLLNPLRCAPPKNKPTPAELSTCAPWVARELELVLPAARVVLCLGAIGWSAALTALANAGVDIPRPRPKFGHGTEATVAGLHLLGCYHPSPHNTYTGRLTHQMFDEIITRAMQLADQT
ncbi:uracil-DNA glycosylase family 4 [Branchiibius hedensis]|uniref:Type-5 uracil-DNA glycosylase n=1 Tax=Branchiibius hedensis TaxID=672460 RepID=A0A2Y8ZTN5_9MICO|nr:uracil-DNA glycosylase [Branchiibius hedensis]PWJ26949.1 uracil-DNA glycosylase family 4 [Branchiibius hedensis]SSA35760.1 uracil-DNA glycosylase, family 4 [Branchiibius hedensis]